MTVHVPLLNGNPCYAVLELQPISNKYNELPNVSSYQKDIYILYVIINRLTIVCITVGRL